jgi:hypothetical protein
VNSFILIHRAACQASNWTLWSICAEQLTKEDRTRLQAEAKAAFGLSHEQLGAINEAIAVAKCAHTEPAVPAASMVAQSMGADQEQRAVNVDAGSSRYDTTRIGEAGNVQEDGHDVASPMVCYRCLLYTTPDILWPNRVL